MLQMIKKRHRRDLSVKNEAKPAGFASFFMNTKKQKSLKGWENVSNLNKF